MKSLRRKTWEKLDVKKGMLGFWPLWEFTGHARFLTQFW